MMYQLEKYKNRNSRHICPMCEDKYSFAYYVDKNNNPINENVGRCNHESSCGYHYTPKDYFRDNPTVKRDFKPTYQPQRRKVLKQLSVISCSYVCLLKGGNNNFIDYLRTLFDNETVKRIINEYCIGYTRNKDIIYWQIDIDGKVRTGKIQGYNKITGKRIKAAAIDSIDWVHSRLKKQGVLPDNWELSQCLYGEHLLSKYPDKVVAIVEGEKNALFGNAMFPDYVWLATGSKHGLQIDKLKVLKGRTVILFPDSDAYTLWLEKSKSITFCKVIVSDLTIKTTSVEAITQGYDIADYIINEIIKKDDKYKA